MTEHDDQVALKRLCVMHEEQYPELKYIYAIPNGGMRNLKVARKLKAEGVNPGAPDLCLPVTRLNWAGLYIEMKVAPNKPTPEQIAYIEFLRTQGYYVDICWTTQSAWDLLIGYLRLPLPGVPVTTDTVKWATRATAAERRAKELEDMLRQHYLNMPKDEFQRMIEGSWDHV